MVSRDKLRKERDPEWWKQEKERKRIYNQIWRNKNRERARELSRRSAEKYRGSHLRRHNQRKIKAVKYLGGKCIRCGVDKHPAAMEFHHRDKNKKEQDVSKLLNCSWERVKAELDKCDLMCANCHKIYHWESRRQQVLNTGVAKNNN